MPISSIMIMIMTAVAIVLIFAAVPSHLLFVMHGALMRKSPFRSDDPDFMMGQRCHVIAAKTLDKESPVIQTIAVHNQTMTENKRQSRGRQQERMQIALPKTVIRNK